MRSPIAIDLHRAISVVQGCHQTGGPDRTRRYIRCLFYRPTAIGDKLQSQMFQARGNPLGRDF